MKNKIVTLLALGLFSLGASASFAKDRNWVACYVDCKCQCSGDSYCFNSCLQGC